MNKIKLLILGVSLMVFCSSNLTMRRQGKFYDSFRESKLIEDKIIKNTNQIEEIANNNNSILFKYDTASMQIKIFPNGESKIYKICGLTTIDSLIRNKIDTIFTIIKFDSIQNPSLLTIVNLKFNKINEKYILKDSFDIKYVEMRTKKSIMKVVMRWLSELRYAYNERLWDGMNKTGKIEVKFAIDEYGSVIFIKVNNTTINDKRLEDKVVKIIKRWKFKRIKNPGDVTEVIYPFVFSR